MTKQNLEAIDLEVLSNVVGGASYGEMCLQGAGTGAALGATLGPKGAAIGAGIGCLVGLGVRAAEGPQS